MKYLGILAALLLFASTVVAQGPPGGPGGPGGPGSGAGPMGTESNGHIYGKLTDTAGKALGGASILILQEKSDPATGKTKDVLVKGITSKNNGSFSAEDLPTNLPLQVRITAVGFNPFSQLIHLGSGQTDNNMGTLKLDPATKELAEVVIKADKPTMTMDMDKKVFNVSKDLVAAGGTGLDVLKNVPSVNVDIDGNISLRGSSPQLLVDGQPTTLTLDEIPSDAIETVEVITNPSAKYDASGGGAGILNIVLKKNRKRGYNGSVRASADSHGGAGGGATLNFRENKINVTADINAREQRDWTVGNTIQNTFNSSPNTSISQHELDTNKGSMLFARLGMDYFASSKTTISLTLFAMMHHEQSPSSITMNSDSLYSTGTVSNFSTERIWGPRSFQGRGGTIGFKQLFAKDKEEWTANGSYFFGNASNNTTYATNTYGADATSPLQYSQLQQIQGGGNDHNIFLQSDYVDPLSSKTTLEAGVKATIQDRYNVNNNYNFDSGEYVLVPTPASNYKSTSDVYAAYATISSSIKNFTYKIGLRAESSSYHGTLLNSGETFSNKYPVSLFPSLFFSQKLGGDQELQLSYTRRVNSPNFFQLIPYTDSSNKLDITRGNPNLVPEFTQSVELSYIKNFKGNNTLMGSIYYKYTNHLITGYVEQDTDYATGATSLINTYINANSSYQEGAELTAQVTLTKWWDANANFNLYHSNINEGNQSDVAYDAFWSWFGKFNTNIKLPKGFAFQVSGMYQSKTNLPVNTNSGQPGPPNMQSQSASQGYIKPFWAMDLGLKKAFLNNKINLTLSVSDVFRTKQQDQYSYSTYFTQENDRFRDPQLFRLNFAYNFGKVDASLFHRRNNNVDQSSE